MVVVVVVVDDASIPSTRSAATYREDEDVVVVVDPADADAEADAPSTSTPEVDPAVTILVGTSFDVRPPRDVVVVDVDTKAAPPAETV